jgi:adenylylsulfate kinase-like enzyme
VSGPGLAVWLTGAPAAGKTAIARELAALLEQEGVRPVHLESDTLRSILTPEPTYEREERDRFYAVLADLAALLAGQGVPVVIDATAPRRAHRRRGREKVARFLEVFVSTPRPVREARDPKGLYRLAREGRAPRLPGATEPYEEPEGAELTVAGDGDARESARRVLAALVSRGWLNPRSE